MIKTFNLTLISDYICDGYETLKIKSAIVSSWLLEDDDLHTINLFAVLPLQLIQPHIILS